MSNSRTTPSSTRYDADDGFDKLMNSNPKAKGNRSSKCRNLDICPNVGGLVQVILVCRGAPLKRAC
jgi:hypothetical protein